MAVISSILIPALQQRFASREVRINESAAPVVVFPAIHQEVGDIEIYDDGDELTVVAGHFTHGHFSNYDEQLSEVEKARQIVEEVVVFLEDMFADQIVLWGSHKGSAGWYHRTLHESQTEHYTKSQKKFVWSGPLE